jgi:hypothetical protein
VVTVISLVAVVVVVLNSLNDIFHHLPQQPKMTYSVKQYQKVKILENIIEHKLNVHLKVI